jgi:transposase-like protein
MAGKRRNSKREQIWRVTMSRWRASGLSIPAFCQRHALTPSAFYYWRRELRERDGAAEPPSSPVLPAFVPLTVIPSVMVAVEVRCPSGHVVTLPACDILSLKNLFAALGPGASC